MKNTFLSDVWELLPRQKRPRKIKKNWHFSGKSNEGVHLGLAALG
jgi:hypothetical protein